MRKASSRSGQHDQRVTFRARRKLPSAKTFTNIYVHTQRERDSVSKLFALSSENEFSSETRLLHKKRKARAKKRVKRFPLFHPTKLIVRIFLVATVLLLDLKTPYVMLIVKQGSLQGGFQRRYLKVRYILSKRHILSLVFTFDVRWSLRERGLGVIFNETSVGHGLGGRMFFLCRLPEEKIKKHRRKKSPARTPRTAMVMIRRKAGYEFTILTFDIRIRNLFPYEKFKKIELLRSFEYFQRKRRSDSVGNFFFISL